MKNQKPLFRAFPVVLSLLLLATLSVLSAASDSAVGGEASQTRVFEGQYKWVNMDSPGPLRAEFTSIGKDRWDVDFQFRFDGRDRTYTGTAVGSLSAGEVKGEVKNENSRRTFTFEATTVNGRIEGTHRETTPSRARRTGTLTLTERVSNS